jgi:hypothetical protein
MYVQILIPTGMVSAVDQIEIRLTKNLPTGK